MQQNRRRLSAAEIREIAVAASADPRSVVRILRGQRVRGMADQRIRRTLSVRGITVADPAPDVEIVDLDFEARQS